MITIVFESHGTTIDNENKIASGWLDVELSELGKEQARELGIRYKENNFDAIFCSDLRRSYDTARIAFGDNKNIIKDGRLRECNYGDLNGHPKQEVESNKEKFIEFPYPNGESFLQTSHRMKSFLDDLKINFSNKKVLIIGHRATQYGLEHWLNSVPLKQAVSAPWQWQPGWIYKI